MSIGTFPERIKDPDKDYFYMEGFQPQYIKVHGEGKYITGLTNIECSIPIITELMEQTINTVGTHEDKYGCVRFTRRIPDDIIEMVVQEFGVHYQDNDESFIIDAENDVNIYSQTDRGLFYAFTALLRVVESGYLERLLAYDFPVCSVRGLKVYLPSESNIGYFKKFVDMISFYRYNTIMIEVGGAMEYSGRSHQCIRA